MARGGRERTRGEYAATRPRRRGTPNREGQLPPDLRAWLQAHRQAQLTFGWSFPPDVADPRARGKDYPYRTNFRRVRVGGNFRRAPIVGGLLEHDGLTRHCGQSTVACKMACAVST